MEPFAGSCAIFLASSFERALLNDVNSDLIGMYGLLRDDGEAFIAEARRLFVAENNTEDRYYELRSEFNASTSVRRRAALFIYLNRHCFNGLCRYNRKGAFNVPFGRYRAPSFPEEAMRNFMGAVGDVDFTCSSFVAAMRAARLGDVVYCDPPYLPLSETSSFTSYAPDAFGIDKQRELAVLARETAGRGVKTVISNHDTAEARELYAGAEILQFDVRRSVSASAGSRGASPELLAIFHPA